jgi:hypothetical protein
VALPSFRTLNADDGFLVIQAPEWIGITLIGAGIVLCLALFIRQLPRPVRLAGFLGTILMLYGGWHLLIPKISIEARGFSIESIYGEEDRVGWLQVQSVDAGGLAGKGMQPGFLLFQLRNSREVGLDLSALDPGEQARVVAFVRAQLKRVNEPAAK